MRGDHSYNWAFHIGPRDGWSIALLMSTGLTFGTIAAFFGLTHGIIDRQQYAILVTAVIASGTIPILIAQRTLNQTRPAASQPKGGSNAE